MLSSPPTEKVSTHPKRLEAGKLREQETADMSSACLHALHSFQAEDLKRVRLLQDFLPKAKLKQPQPNQTQPTC